MIEEIAKIAAYSGNCRQVLTYSGDDRYVAGVSDGVTTPIVSNGTLDEIVTDLAAKLPGYLETAEKEAADRKAKEEAAKHEAEVKVAEAKLKQEATAKKTAEKKVAEENKANQLELF